MADTTNPGDKKLGVTGKTLSLKPRVETGTVRQSFPHGRTKQVVVEKRGKRRIGEGPAAEPARAPEPAAAKAAPATAKAGQVVSGFAKVEAALTSRQGGTAVLALIHASDGAEDGIRKLDALARQKAGNEGGTPEFSIITALTSAELDLALGRSNVVHAALLAGPASKTFLSRSQILVRYRLTDADNTAGTVARNTTSHSTSSSK